MWFDLKERHTVNVVSVFRTSTITSSLMMTASSASSKFVLQCESKNDATSDLGITFLCCIVSRVSKFFMHECIVASFFDSQCIFNLLQEQSAEMVKTDLSNLFQLTHDQATIPTCKTWHKIRPALCQTFRSSGVFRICQKPEGSKIETRRAEAAKQGVVLYRGGEPLNVFPNIFSAVDGFCYI